ncbi:uncharacterized protein LOC121785289 [Salvia splendens]|uniref:uncharacterized protein LOC121785289 n=1 Tax=Salvia splendens TaxID=180675 RepID=UPI001C26E2BE|nr:uncharacterized protein LOC121785289 [Salvia splendens]
MSQGIKTDFGVVSYFNFMKTLINYVKDVKVLREKGILYSQLANDEEVVEMFQSINTYGFSNTDLFLEGLLGIEEVVQPLRMEVLKEVSDLKMKTMKDSSKRGNYEGLRSNEGPPRCTVKIDLWKAYDTVDWSFLRGVLQGLKFHPSFVHLIMECVTSPLYTITVNGSHHGYFRGIFVSIRNASELAILTLLLQMTSFCSAGLGINQSKSNMFIAGAIKVPKETLLQVFAFPEGTLPIKCLGIPLASKRLATSDYGHLIDNLTDKIKKWQGVESYWLQAFPIPGTVIEKLIGIACSFLWGKKYGQVAWDDVCKPKTEGGLGIRNLKAWNSALHTKTLWNIHSKKDSF